MSSPSTVNLDWKSPEFQKVVFDVWLEQRQQCRTELFFLCKVLGFKDANEKIHRPIVDRLQKFLGGKDKLSGFESSLYNEEYKGYEPAVPIYNLDSSTRYNLILYPRLHLKTTIATVAHSVQWIINYPNVRIFISTATGKLLNDIYGQIRRQFQFNEYFRYLFPDFCPHKDKVSEFGNMSEFSVPCRQVTFTKEPTVRGITIGATVAGDHCDVLKNDDLVDKENVKTPDSILAVKEHFAALEPLPDKYMIDQIDPAIYAHVGNKGWTDVVGTRYNFSDLYGTIIDAEAVKPEDRKIWGIINQSACLTGNTVQSLYEPGAKALWPEKVPIEELQKIAENPGAGPAIVAAQYLQNPVTDDEGLVKTEDDIIWKSPEVVSKLYDSMVLNVTIDLAGMEPNLKGQDNDYTVLNLHGYLRDGSLWILDVRHGRFSPFQVIDQMFELYKVHPRIRMFKIEKEAHARVLLPFLKAEFATRGFLPILALPRDNRVSKAHRIRGLQALFFKKRIAFSLSIPEETRKAMINEIMRFPKYSHDDFLDTTADALQGADGEITSDLIPRQKDTQYPPWFERGEGIFDIPTYATRMEDMLERLRGEELNTGKIDSVTGF